MSIKNLRNGDNVKYLVCYNASTNQFPKVFY